MTDILDTGYLATLVQEIFSSLFNVVVIRVEGGAFTSSTAAV